MEKGRIKFVYPGGNTAGGFHSFYHSGLQGMERIFILKGGPGTGKSTLMRKIGLAMAERGYDIEFWQCSSDNDSLDGVLIPAIKAAVIDGTAPHIVDPRFPGVVDEIVNLGDHWDERILKEQGAEVKGITSEIGGLFANAYQYLRAAKEVHDEWKKVYSQAMDFQLADRKADELVREIFSVPEPKVRHLFATAITPKGMVNFMDNITAECRVRFIVKGQPGTGKSALLKRVAAAAAERGLQVDVFHCALDPESIDMVMIPELGTAVLDGMPPHLIDPVRPGDRLIQMGDCLDLQETGKIEGKTEEMEAEFYHLAGEGAKKIAQAKALHDHLETFYVRAMDFGAVDRTRNRVMQKILDLAEADRG